MSNTIGILPCICRATQTKFINKDNLWYLKCNKCDRENKQGVHEQKYTSQQWNYEIKLIYRAKSLLRGW